MPWDLVVDMRPAVGLQIAGRVHCKYSFTIKGIHLRIMGCGFCGKVNLQLTGPLVVAPLNWLSSCNMFFLVTFTASKKQKGY